jgi:hypothetical protein
MAFHVSGESKFRLKMADTNQVSDITLGYKRLSFIAEMELGRLDGSTVSTQRTASCGNTLMCVCYFVL